MLDATKQELHQRYRGGLVDEPGKPSDHLVRLSELGDSVNALIDAALARAGALNTDVDDPLVLIAEEAGLSLAEYEAVAMAADGMSWERIAKAQHVREGVARRAAARGTQKLRRYVSTAGKFILNS